ncbi:cyclic peptide export ABC transporter [Paracraurococcus lichenis]|uniref:Cyclic peptide export ABC transporter n=1 Tax=Paracraurococcus lichenis TaxID=3064888 RepID=A0ABT9E958_9PROT|nr:cyclic peptide export ABC transporter [Paracraurococcus sp. LOR1-02]MDO9712719.1 cyclic peptide export ABC transporter [Paracraurococcus sp. LOR1-02]
MTHLGQLLRQDVLRAMRPLLAMAVATAIAHVAILTTMNEAVARLTDADAVSRLLLMFVAANMLYSLFQVQYMRMASKRIERAIAELRNRLVTRVCAAEMLDVNTIGHARVTEALGSEFQTISQAVPTIVVGSHCLAVVLLASLYVVTFSVETFCLLVLIAGLQIVITWRAGRKMDDGVGDAHDSTIELADRVRGLMAGFREAKINPVRARRIQEDIAATAHKVMKQRAAANVRYARDYTTAESMYYISVGAVIFLLPAIATVRLDTITMAANAISFIVYPLHILMASLPTYLNAENAARTVLNVDGKLNIAALKPPAEAWANFRSLSLEKLGFRHSMEAGSFSVGPLDLTVRQGEIVFVTGGNGSGKSTMMHMLLGLYPASRGHIRVDGRTVDADTVASYRQLFSVIFSDNHLEREIIGVPAVDEPFADELLELLEMSDKVRIENGAFSTVALSGGQRKRLALVAALLERKPILVLDEWAADQSPQFRETFYRRILPWIQAQGTTVIAVSHDDKYFDVADQLIQVTNGRIVTLEASAVSLAQMS